MSYFILFFSSDNISYAAAAVLNFSVASILPEFLSGWFFKAVYRRVVCSCLRTTTKKVEGEEEEEKRRVPLVVLCEYT